MGREVGVCQHDLVAVTHLGEDLEEVGGDDGRDSFQDHFDDSVRLVLLEVKKVSDVLEG